LLNQCFSTLFQQAILKDKTAHTQRFGGHVKYASHVLGKKLSPPYAHKKVAGFKRKTVLKII